MSLGSILLNCIKNKSKIFYALNIRSLNSSISDRLKTYNVRCYSATPAPQFKQLVVKAYGEPENAVVMMPMILPDSIKGTEVLARVLVATVHPIDINVVEGTCICKPKCPFVPGNEGVLEILDVGKDVTELKKGDIVIPRPFHLGLFRSALVAEEHDFIKVPSDIDVFTASTLMVNPSSAYRMINDFISLKAGDVIIQNLANSALGQAVIQIAADKGIKTINIVRPRPNLEELKEFLGALGANLVVTIQEIRENEDLLNEFPKARLGLNGVGGKDAIELMRWVEEGGTVVTYGGMSKQPLFIPTREIVFRRLNFRGWYLPEWGLEPEDNCERKVMMDYLFDLVRRGKLIPPPHKILSMEDFKTAFRFALPTEGMVGRKQMLVF